MKKKERYHPTLLPIIFCFYITGILCAQQDINLKSYNESIDTFYEVLINGGTKKYDSLIPKLANLEIKLKKDHPKEYVGALVFQARMLTMRRRMQAAQNKLRLAKYNYVKLNVMVPAYEQVFHFLDGYLKLQITRKYDYEGTQSALEKIKKYKEVDEVVLAQMEENVGKTDIDFANYNKALEHFKKAKDIYHKKGLRLLEAGALNLMGVAHDGLENLDSVLYYSELSIQEFEALKNPNYLGLASATYNVGLLYHDRLNNANRAEAYYKKAVVYDIKDAGETNPYLCVDYRALAETYILKNDITKALLYAEKAVEQGEKYFGKNDSRTAQAMLVLSKTHLIKGNIERANFYVEMASDIFGGMVSENHRWFVDTYFATAEIRKSENKNLEAEVLWEKALAISKRIERELYIIQAYEKLTLHHEENGNYPRAIKYSDSLAILLKNKFKEAKYRQWNQRLMNLRLRQSASNHKILASEIEELKIDFPSKKSNPALWLSLLEIQLDPIPISNDQIEDCKKNLDMLLDLIALSRNNFSNQQNRIFYNKKLQRLIEKGLYTAFMAYQKTNDLFFKDIVFKLMEVNKNSALLEGLQNVRYKKIGKVPPSLITLEQETLEALQDTKQNILYLYNKKKIDSVKLRSLKNRLITLDAKNDSINQVLVKAFPKYRQLKKLSVKQSYQEYRKNYQKSDEVVLEYLLGEKGWYRFMMTNDHVTIERFDNVEELRDMIHKLRKGLLGRKKIAKACKQLYSWLIPDLPKTINTVSVVADDVLSFVPFEILNNGSGYLFEEYALRYGGSLQLLKEQGLIAKEGEKWCGFAPEYTENVLPRNQKEVQEIGKLIQGEVFLRKEATKTNFINNATGKDILHLALHTELDKVNPMNNRMLFSKDSTEIEESRALTASEVYGLELDANLVVLSSCNTGFGKLESGEGVMNISRAFTYAGVSSTLISLWKVPDKETAQIMTYFYKFLKKGQSKDVALQNAKLEYLANTEDELLKHPYYWAGFIVSGDTSPIVEKYYWPWLLVVLGIVLSVLLFRKKSVERL